MKRITLLILIAFILNACQITERIYLSESGSVKYESEINFSEMMSFMYNEENIDSLKSVGQFPIDTLLSISNANDFQNNNKEKPTPAEKKLLESLNKSKIQIVMSEDEGKVVVISEDKDVKSFNSYLKKADKYMREYQESDEEASDKFTKGAYISVLELKYDGKTFERKSLSPRVDLNELSDTTSLSSRDMMGMFGYRMEYHFPKKIKSIDLKNAVISEDGKTVAANLDYLEVVENPQKFNFKVEFE